MQSFGATDRYTRARTHACMHTHTHARTQTHTHFLNNQETGIVHKKTEMYIVVIRVSLRILVWYLYIQTIVKALIDS